MSAAPILEPLSPEAVQPLGAPTVGRPGRPHRPLRLVPPPAPRQRRRGRRRAPFIVLIALLCVGGLVSLLLLNTVLAQDAYTLHSLQKETAALADTEQALAQQVAQAENPAVLAERARSLGLVPAPNPVFVRGSDGTILGVPTPAVAPAAPTQTPAP